MDLCQTQAFNSGRNLPEAERIGFDRVESRLGNLEEWIWYVNYRIYLIWSVGW